MTKPCLLAFALAALAPLAPAQVMRGGRLAINQPDTYDGLMIATAVSAAVKHPVGDDPNLVVQTFRVEDSHAFSAGSTVDVYFEVRGGSTTPFLVFPGQPYPLGQGTVPVGAHVLLVAAAAHGGFLRYLFLETFDPRDVPKLPLDSGAGPSALGVAWYPTRAARLADDPAPQWRLLGSLAESIPGTSEAYVQEIVDFLGSLPVRWGTDGRGEDRFARTFSNAVKNDTAYHRALIDFALNQLRYLGYEQRWVRDLHAAAEDPNAFPDYVPQLSFHEDPSAGRSAGWPKDYKPAPPIEEDAVSLLLRAKSPTIAAAFLKDLKQPSDDRVRALAAKYLAFPDPRPRWAMVERLAWWNGHPTPDKPTTVMDPVLGVERTDYPGLAEAVAYWKAKLGV